MRKTLLVSVIMCGVLLTLAILNLGDANVATVQADALLQDVPRLDGYVVYFTESGGEASRFDRSDAGLSRYAGLLRQLGANLKTLETRSNIPDDADLIVIAGPTAEPAADQIARLWSYLNHNGKLLLIVDPPAGRNRAYSATRGFFELTWSDMSLRGRDDVVVTEGGAEGEPGLISNFATDNYNANFPIGKEITDPAAFFGARSIEFDASPSDFTVTPLLYSPSTFYGETAFEEYEESGDAEYNIGRDITRSALALSVAFENTRTSTRMVVIGDRDFVMNGAGLQTSPPNSPSFLHPGNVRFLLNVTTWLLGTDAVEVSFPTPGPTATPTLTPTPVVTSADVAVSIAVGNDTATEGETIIYTVEVTNNGPDAAAGVDVSIPLAEGFSYVSSTPSAGPQYNSNTGHWIAGSIAANNTVTLTLVVTVDAGTGGSTIAAEATVESSTDDPDTDNNSASVDVTIGAAS